MTELTTMLISKTRNNGVSVKDTTSKPEYAENHEKWPRIDQLATPRAHALIAA